MKRGATGDIFLKLIERIRRTIPGVAIRTSMIAGFPGETAQDFETLCDFVKAAQFDRLGVFSYSDEDTSASFALDQKVDGRTIHNRKRRLMAIQRKISRARNRLLVGQELPVLVEGPTADSDLVWQARLSTQAPEIDGVCYISDPGETPPRAGEIRKMRITAAHDYDLTGDLIERCRRSRTDSTCGMKCPICKKEVQLTDPFVPFCSERCSSSTWATGRPINMSSRLPSSLPTKRKIDRPRARPLHVVRMRILAARAGDRGIGRRNPDRMGAAELRDAI